MPLLAPGLMRQSQGRRRAAATAPRARRPRVIVLEDAPSTRELLSQVLSDAGLEVERAAGGQAALALIEYAEPDLVLSDIDLPTPTMDGGWLRMASDGFALLRHIRARARRLPVIMLTGRSSEEYQRRAMAEGAGTCLLKSGFQVASLLDTLSWFLPASFSPGHRRFPIRA